MAYTKHYCTDITVLELYPIVADVELWGGSWANMFASSQIMRPWS